MKETSVPVIVLTERRDDVEFFNKTMRDAGHAVRCQGLNRIEDLQQVLESQPPHLLIHFADHHSVSIREIAKQRQLLARMTPLVVIRNSADETAISDAMQAGAQDLVSSALPARLSAVCERELRTFRLERALNETLSSASAYKKDLKSFMSASTDAIAIVQEGIVVEANQAWADLFSGSNIENSHGPLMDYFVAGSQAALKGALMAARKGQWEGGTLRIDAHVEGKTATVELTLEAATHDGEPATRFCIPHRRAAAEVPAAPAAIVEQALKTDPVTGFYQRQQFLELLTDKLDHRKHGGARALAFVRPDRFGEIERDIGPVASEEIIAQIADVTGRLMSESDIAGRFGGTVFALILERGSLRDIEAWAENVLSRIAQHVFEVAQRSLSLTCTVGLAELGEDSDRVEDLIRNAEKANRRGRKEGGNKVVVEETADENTRMKRMDEIWVRQIRAALVDGRFRLMHLNIASLTGQAARIFDTYVRMVDEQGDEVSAADFMATATRSNLLRPIDRWVIDASLSFCSREANDLVFVKLSHESILDPTLPAWIFEQVPKTGIRPQNLCFQISEDDASKYQKPTKLLADILRGRGFRFAVEQFGVGRDPLRVLTSTPMDFVKFDGSLMQSVADDFKTQDKLRAFISTASKQNIQTIAARVENANTMAVLFQLGVGYMQGHYLQEPAEVVLEAAG
jgi:diguanylate cyclase (GGDEF)-like protein